MSNIFSLALCLFSCKVGKGYAKSFLWDPNRNAYVDAEQHPRDWAPYGNTAGEEWADMWANYIAGNFASSMTSNLADSAAGYSRYVYVTSILIMMNCGRGN